ncbi:MAG: L-2-hydroxyglutarate oxidase [Ignavibacteriaceae bacterium]|jgi:L-2-hydroxyglutarate oxidase
MNYSKTYQVAIIGGGIIGASTALNLLKIKNISLIVLEAEEKLSAHQTGNNSGVIHSGIYYKPGTLKALNCAAGRVMMYKFCEENNIKHERCGKIIIAVNNNEIPLLDELEQRGKANGLKGLKRLSPEEIKEHEPFAFCVDGLFVPETGIVDYIQVTETFGRNIMNLGGEIKTGSKFISLSKDSNDLVLQTTSGEVRAKFLVNCAGLQSDRIAKLCGVNPKLQIIPFRGEYYKLKQGSEYLVKNLVYPVPNPEFPFLGVHFTRMINGGIEAGPNAVLAFKREGYSKKDFSFPDISQMLFYSGFWKMIAKHYKMGIGEFYRSFNKSAFVKELQRLVPGINYDDIYSAGSGVRAQALEPDGKLVDDFRIVEAEKMIHVLNAPSPAATASLSIGKMIAEKVINRIGRI